MFPMQRFPFEESVDDFSVDKSLEIGANSGAGYKGIQGWIWRKFILYYPLIRVRF